MSSASVAASIDTSAGKLPVKKLLNSENHHQAEHPADGEVNATTTTSTPVVIIKADPSEDSPAPSLSTVQNGVGPVIAATVVATKGAAMSGTGSEVKTDNGPIVDGDLAAGDAKTTATTINGTNQNRMIRVSP